jgi:hypothetical protein
MAETSEEGNATECLEHLIAQAIGEWIRSVVVKTFADLLLLSCSKGPFFQASRARRRISGARHGHGWHSRADTWQGPEHLNAQVKVSEWIRSAVVKTFADLLLQQTRYSKQVERGGRSH